MKKEGRKKGTFRIGNRVVKDPSFREIVEELFEKLLGDYSYDSTRCNLMTGICTSICNYYYRDGDDSNGIIQMEEFLSHITESNLNL